MAGLAKDNVRELAAQVQTDVVRWRRELHAIPELGLDLPQTAAYIKRELTKLGISYKTYLGGMGIAARIEGKKDSAGGLSLGLRADMDALPITEQTGLDFAAQNGNMHACGHDGHMAILLAAGKILSSRAELFGGEVVLIFQPSEELPPGGALLMIEEGLLEDFPLDFILGLHAGMMDPDNKPGTINWKAGPVMAAIDTFKLRLIGQGAHGGYPELSRDPITAAAYLITALQSIKSRNVKSAEQAVITIGSIKGGIRENIIPETVEMMGTVRSFSADTRKLLEKRIREIASGISQAMDVKLELEFENNYPALLNKGTEIEKVMASLKKVFHPSELSPMKEGRMSGEDFAYFLQEVPGVFLFLTNPKEQDGIFYPNHHPSFDLEEDQLALGVMAFLQIALDLL